MAINTLRSTARYKDFYTDFDAHPVRKDLYVLEDTDAIKRSIKNLIFTDPGERFFSPLLGSGIRRALFENISPETTNIIETFVTATIENHEPRAKLLDLIVNPTPDENAYNIQITFSTINNPAPVIFNVLLSRVR
jgi:phage baseplate assembly protein W